MEVLVLAVYLAPPLLLLATGLIVGGLIEARHLRSLDRREQQLASMLVTDLRSFAPDVEGRGGAQLVVGEAAIGTDYLKSFLAQLRNIFGGEVKSFVSLTMRARREALLRVMEGARASGFDAVCNVRLETSDIGTDVTRRGRGLKMAGVIASGTAYRRTSPEGHPYR